MNLYNGLTPADISEFLRDVPNRIGFISSRFESFSYALVESLGFEYAPVTWFNNELVSQLSKAGLCTELSYGDLLGDGGKSIARLADTDKAKYFLEKMVERNVESYQSIISNTFLTEV